MRRLALYTFLVLVALNAFGHAGEVHNYMGTVTEVREDGSFLLQKTDGTSMHVLVSANTAYLTSGGKAASRADVAAGRRVVATISTDGKTASAVKIGAAKK